MNKESDNSINNHLRTNIFLDNCIEKKNSNNIIQNFKNVYHRNKESKISNDVFVN